MIKREKSKQNRGYVRLMLGADNKKQWIRYISISCLPVRQVLNFFNIRIYVTIALNVRDQFTGKVFDIL